MRWIKHLILPGLLLLTLCGCANSSNMVVDTAGIQELENQSSQADYHLPITRLDHDLWRAARRLGWAMPYPIKPDMDGHYRGKGMMPDGRQLIVDAWPNENDTDQFTVNVKIGHFGDAQRQAWYLSKLREVLKGDPMPKRGLNFTKDDVVKKDSQP